MKHFYTNKDREEHYSVGRNLYGKVLVQLGDKEGCQIRIELTPEQAKHLSDLILSNIEKIDKETEK